MKDFQIPRNDIQIFPERNPSRMEQIPNPAERNPNSKSFNFLRRIEPYQRVTPTLRHFGILRRFRP
jgi:hypothetical protein